MSDTPGVSYRSQHPTRSLRCAAVRHHVYGVFEGANHGMAYYEACEAHNGLICEDFECGFITLQGEFVTRDEVSERIGGVADACEILE